MTSAELRARADYVEGQEKRAEEALAKKSALSRFWSAEFGAGIGNREGEFVGLACRSCKRWEDSGHEDDCAVAELERLPPQAGSAAVKA